MCRVSREAGITDHGTVFTRELDDDSLSDDVAAVDAVYGSGPDLAELFHRMEIRAPAAA